MPIAQARRRRISAIPPIKKAIGTRQLLRHQIEQPIQIPCHSLRRVVNPSEVYTVFAVKRRQRTEAIWPMELRYERCYELKASQFLSIVIHLPSSPSKTTSAVIFVHGALLTGKRAESGQARILYRIAAHSEPERAAHRETVVIRNGSMAPGQLLWQLRRLLLPVLGNPH